MASASSSVKITYMRMLRLAKRLPAADRSKALSDIKSGFRNSSGETDESKIRELLDNAAKRLSYLKMVTPKRPEDNDMSEYARKYVVHDGRVVYAGPGDGDFQGLTAGRLASKAGMASTAGSGELKKHEANLKRFTFQDRPGGAPKSPFSGS